MTDPIYRCTPVTDERREDRMQETALAVFLKAFRCPGLGNLGHAYVAEYAWNAAIQMEKARAKALAGLAEPESQNG